MNDDARLINAALDRRFSRTEVPACPEAAWRPAVAAPATTERPRRVPHRFAYAAALLALAIAGGVTAQASDTIKAGYLRFMTPFAGSTTPLRPIIHRADQLTVAEAQRRMPFTIVQLAGLPADTHLLYAHILSEGPTPRVALSYQAHIAGRYYRINVNESTVAVGPPVSHMEVRYVGHPTKSWNVPINRFKHGDVVMDVFAPGIPPAMTDKIVRATTM